MRYPDMISAVKWLELKKRKPWKKKNGGKLSNT